jgi:hypothetical protein
MSSPTVTQLCWLLFSVSDTSLPSNANSPGIAAELPGAQVARPHPTQCAFQEKDTREGDLSQNTSLPIALIRSAAR